MFNKIEISLWRAVFWPVANLSYWALIFLSWWDTRVKVYFGFSVIQKIFELRSFSAVAQFYGELENEAYSAIAAQGPIAGDFIIIPLIMSVVMFVVPFIVRRDNARPVTGYVVLPAMTLLCYFFASFLNMILVAAMSAGIHYLLFKVPGPDICMFMVHPLYLIYPIFKSIPGFLSQCLYLAFIATVLCTDSAARTEDGEDFELGPDGEEFSAGDGEDDWNRSACLMEMDRLSRIINSKFSNPTFADRVREEVAAYINTPGLVNNQVNRGSNHYRIVLTATLESMHGILSENSRTLRAREAFTFIVDEMARMEFISEEAAVRTKLSMGIAPIAKKISDAQTPPAESPAVHPVRPTEVHRDNQRFNEITRISEPEATETEEPEPREPEPSEAEEVEPEEIKPEEKQPEPIAEPSDGYNEQWDETDDYDSVPQETESRPPWALS